MCDVATRCGAQVVRVDHEWGEPVDAERVLRAHPDPMVIAVLHAETSTGVRSDIEPLGAGKGDALLLVDCVTSLGGSEVAIDAWDVDIAYSGTQKCLGVPPGLAPLTMSDRARERMVERCQSWYLDLRMIGDYAGPAALPRGAGAPDPGKARKYHHTAPISMVMSLHAGLGVLLEEGRHATIARHESCGAALQDGLVKLGLDLIAPDGHRLPQLTTVRVPDGVDEASVRRTLLEQHGIEIGAGVGPFAGSAWRIGCMGHTARMRNVTLILAALADLLR
jgi:alanine-glyoxylate transaminase/serine-glyoxylate transaminase/serine-pyruvate transaminase